MRVVPAISMLGVVLGFAIVLAWFVTPDLGRYWLIIGGLILTVFGCTGFVVTRPRRHEY